MEHNKTTRRDFLKKAGLWAGAITVTAWVNSCNVRFTRTKPGSETTVASEGTSAEGETKILPTPNLDPTNALTLLVNGNRRFYTGNMQHARIDAARRKQTFESQRPFAAILTCSDSRIPPEIIFDQGIGDIFIIRTAGNVAGNIALGSIEYAVEHLGVGLVVVLGHQKCEFISAAVQGTPLTGHMTNVINEIKPAVVKAKAWPGDLLTNSVYSNVNGMVDIIKATQPILTEFISSNVVQVIGASYDPENGVVSITSISDELKATLPQATPTAMLTSTSLPPTPTPQPTITLTSKATSAPATSTSPTSTPFPTGIAIPGSTYKIIGRHIVRSGETLTSIARAYGVEANAIASANSIETPNYIMPGQVLLIPDVPLKDNLSGPIATRQF